ncbi:AAA family ATPase, partial [Caminibacter sp.]
MTKLPIGESSFEKIRKKDFTYVDKTRILYDLITNGEFYFLSRPRRFGKSLLISTLKHIFLANKELFKGLWIYDSDYEWEK